MAKSVVTLETESRRETGRTERGERYKDRGFGALLVSGLTLFAVAVSGYHPYAEDGGLYVAGVKRLLDPALYPHGTEFVLEPMRLSAFAATVAGLVRMSHMSLPVVLLGLHLASVWVALYAAWMLATRCWRTREAQAGAVVLLACWLAIPVAGTALMLMDPYVTARSFSTPCMILALVGVLDFTDGRRGGLLLWVASLVVAGAMHPLMAVYALGATLLLACVRSSRREVRLWATAAMVVTAMVAAAGLRAIARPESADYIRVALTRTYWFPAEWQWFELVGLVAPLVILGMQGWGSSAETYPSESSHGAPYFEARQSVARMAVALGVAACLVAMAFARAGMATHLVARMQPLRTFQIVYVVMILAMGAKLGAAVLRVSAWRWAAAMVLFGGVMLQAERGEFPDSHHVELPGVAVRNPWMQAFVWIRENTPKDALFALDAGYIKARKEDAQCFRVIAERSALPDYSKDGGEAAIAPELTAAWQIGQAAQQGLSAATDAERTTTLGPLGVTWVVIQTGATTDFDCPYANDAVRVCRLR